MRKIKGIIFLVFALMALNPRSAAYGSMDFTKSVNSLERRLQQVVDGTLVFIRGRKLSSIDMTMKAPQQRCLRGVKIGLFSAGILNRYPAWKIARTMDKVFRNASQTKRFLRDGYKFVQLKNVKKVEDAPAYSILIYEGAPYGHIEMKVPANYLSSRGFTHALKSVNGKESGVALSELENVYLSDYIDAYPRNHPESRVANSRPNNTRPLKAVFQIQRI